MENDLVPIRRLVLLSAALAMFACGLLPSVAAAAPAAANPTSLGFGQETVGGSSASQFVTVSNPDPGTVQILGVSVVGANQGDFTITAESCAFANLGQGGACAVRVAFAPTAGGSREATLEVTVEGEAPVVVPLFGTGQTKRLVVPGSASFPATSVSAASSQSIVLKNASEAGVNLNEVKIEGVNPGDFEIESDNCGSFIGQSMNCELTLRFMPVASGPREAQLRVSTDATPSDYVVDLTGEGVAPELTFEPGHYDFGLVEAHSNSPRTSFTLRNTGAASVSLSNPEITGPDVNEFYVPNNNCGGSTLSPGATCSIEVQFDDNSEGSFAAAVSINGGGVNFQAPLTARAENPRIEGSPLVFGPTSVGSRQIEEMTLTNTGHLPVAFFIALVSGGDIGSFHLVEENCTSNVFAGNPRLLEPGESCTAEVAFEPGGVGTKAATVSFFGGGEGALQVPVEGTGVAARPSGEATSPPPAVAIAATQPTAAAGGAPRGRVALELNLLARPASGGVAIGRARCASSTPCVIRLGGLVSGLLPTASGPRAGIRGLPVSQLRLAPGASATITIALPQELRAPSATTTLRVSLHWQTGSERGSAGRSFRLGR